MSLNQKLRVFLGSDPDDDSDIEILDVTPPPAMDVIDLDSAAGGGRPMSQRQLQMLDRDRNRRIRTLLADKRRNHLNVDNRAVTNEDDFETLIQLLPQSEKQSLQWENHDGYDLNFQDMHRLIDALPPSISELSLDGHGVHLLSATDGHPQSIMEKILSKPQLTYLSVRGNILGGNRASEFRRLLSNHTNLESLNLASTGMNEDAAEELSNALVFNRTLKQLNVRNNPISKERMNAIVEGMMFRPNNARGRVSVEVDQPTEEEEKAYAKARRDYDLSNFILKRPRRS